MWGMNEMDTALFIAWFIVAGVWVFTLAYYNEQVAYYERWVSTAAYAARLQVKVIEAEGPVTVAEEIETGD
jgi:multisubunit Na+/H+ antiporter MnhE subunit